MKNNKGMITSVSSRAYPFSRHIPKQYKKLQASEEDGILVLRGLKGASRRKILYVNSYGMAKAWRLWREGMYPGNHLWGCLELATMGYEILIPEPVTGGRLVRRLKTDWHPALTAINRLTQNDIVYCGHNVLLWTPFFKALRLIKCKIIGMLFAREPLFLPNIYDGVIAHTPLALKHATSLCPKASCVHISWGMDLDFFEPYPYTPEWFLSTGKTCRDFEVMMKAFDGLNERAVLVHSQPNSLVDVPKEIRVELDRNLGEEVYLNLANHYYRFSRAVLITLQKDPSKRRAVGITNLMESMACARPVIVTRTGGQLTELDVEKEGIGLYVEPGDASSLQMALLRLTRNPEEAREMGLRGRQLCEQFFNIGRFATELHAFLDKL